MQSPFIAPSAHRQGVDDKTILHAFNNPIRAEDLDDELTMLIGPDQAAISMRSASSARRRVP
jgi:hypothetical protein